jgi:hypothetical protein
MTAPQALGSKDWCRKIAGLDREQLQATEGRASENPTPEIRLAAFRPLSPDGQLFCFYQIMGRKSTSK